MWQEKVHQQRGKPQPCKNCQVKFIQEFRAASQVNRVRTVSEWVLVWGWVSIPERISAKGDPETVKPAHLQLVPSSSYWGYHELQDKILSVTKEICHRNDEIQNHRWNFITISNILVAFMEPPASWFHPSSELFSWVELISAFSVLKPRSSICKPLRKEPLHIQPPPCCPQHPQDFTCLSTLLAPSSHSSDSETQTHNLSRN